MFKIQVKISAWVSNFSESFVYRVIRDGHKADYLKFLGTNIQFRHSAPKNQTGRCNHVKNKKLEIFGTGARRADKANLLNFNILNLIRFKG